ncbi:tRNA lysidine(34) synthetase TilS [Brevundimonas sp.]|uniref:tRNA lysidine(34) synthetase TilS n=1 Tax=Brevundimonas sp. TaxID=1871086 RepID=UPI0039C87FDB
MPLTDPEALTARVRARLDARLCRDEAAPLAVALSGGGDSVALLALVADWARVNGRRVLALTVDHGLNPDSRDWSGRCAAQARALGTDWRELSWTGDKPATGLPAAARAARHALLADAARAAGARVILMGHTADDVAESDLIRAEGTPIGRLREWSPSPAWPEGRGLMLVRPLLGERREALRDLLRARRLDWIEDPANADLRFARARVRAQFPLPAGEGLRLAERQRCASRKGEGLPVERSPSPFRVTNRFALGRSSPLPPGEGTMRADRSIAPASLAAALTCVGGGVRSPRGDALARLTARLRSGDDFDVVLCGARLTARGDEVLIHREPGEQRRQGLAPLRLEPGQPCVWDGRFEIAADAPGLTVVPARGLLNRLSPADRAALNALPPAARGAEPVLIQDGDLRPVLAGSAARVRSLVEARLAAALDATSHEADLFRDRMAPGRPPAYLETDAAIATGDRLTERTE